METLEKMEKLKWVSQSEEKVRVSDGGEVLVDGGVEAALLLEHVVVVVPFILLLQLLLRLQTQLGVKVLHEGREQKPPREVVLALS